jgi:four helix bundle protein
LDFGLGLAAGAGEITPMNEREFKERTKRDGLRVVRLVESLPSSRTADVLGRQLLRSGTSVGANYRAACRGRSRKDVIAKLGIVEEEADENVYWMEMLVDAGIVPGSRLDDLIAEFNEIVAMTVASIRTLRNKGRKPADFRSNPKSKIQNLKSGR